MPGCCPKFPPANNFDPSLGKKKREKRLLKLRKSKQGSDSQKQ